MSGGAHHPEVMLCVLVTILGFDDVTCLGSGTGHCHVSHVARLGIDTLAGPLSGGTRCESVGAGSGRPAVVPLMSSHVSRRALGMTNLLRDGGDDARGMTAGLGSECSFRSLQS